MTDWSKAMEIFGSGIIGVFLVMIVLQLMTQLSTWVIDQVENRLKAKESEENEEPRPRAVAVKE